MPQPNKIPKPFAASGDKNTIPESTETIGLASWNEGFPAITSTPFAEGGLAPKRADFNGIFNALSQAVMWLQQGGVYAYDVNTDYEAGNVTLDAGGLYVANAANGPSSAVVQPSTDTTGATWKLVRLNLATQSAPGYMSAEDKAALDGIPTTYLPLSGGTMTGTIAKSNGYVIKSTGTNNYLAFLGGVSGTATEGAQVIVHGPDHAQSGAFILHAGNSTGYKRLIGKPDGTLTWDDSQVVTESDLPVTSQVSTQPYAYKLKFPSGAMIQGYFSYSEYTDTNGRITWTFPEAFIQDPFVAISKLDAAQSLNMYSTNKSRTIFRVNNMNGTNVGSGVKSGMMGIAIGRWK